MQERSLRVLEYDKIIAMLSAQALSAPGRARCETLLPGCDLAEIEARHEETDDFVSLLYKIGELSLSGFDSLGAEIDCICSGSVPPPVVFLRVSRQLGTAAGVQSRTPSEWVERGIRNSALERMLALNPLAHLRRRINDCILGEDEIADRASPALYGIRRAIQRAQEDIRVQLDKLLKTKATALQDQLVTLRQDRYVIPVKAEHRSEVPGIVHDSSSSGSTVFVEPMVVVELNNKIRLLRGQEQEEIDRILAELANMVAAESVVLRQNEELLAQLDFGQAKAKLAKLWQATRPLLNDEGRIALKRARHPLIPKEQVVPIDLELGFEFSSLIITGPNTGGKTVSLKTCGLFSLLAMAGLQIPVNQGSEASVFTEVFADIGDEQSIEQSLSTFSSHIRHISQIVDKVGRHSLVLLDELGAGTDPSEGAALAIAILDFLKKRGAGIVATTHYQELKGYALNTAGVRNACCEFDTASLRPTYRLLIGVPGVSNALAISKRLGLNPDIIAEAESLISDEGQRFESLVAAIEQSHRRASTYEEEISQLKTESLRLQEKLREDELALKQQRTRILNEARDEAAKILMSAREEATETLEQMREQLSAPSEGKRRQALYDTRARLANRAGEIAGEGRSEADKAHLDRPLEAEDIEIGALYYAERFNFCGQAIEKADGKGQLTLRSGQLQLKVPLSSIRRASEDQQAQVMAAGLEKSPSRGSGTPVISKRMLMSTELYLLGKTVSEALAELDQYLDDAALTNLEQVRIVHGKGSGALRTAIHNALKKDKRVKKYQLAAYGEGDAGVTQVFLR